jgi:hypothetical protein
LFGPRSRCLASRRSFIDPCSSSAPTSPGVSGRSQDDDFDVLDGRPAACIWLTARPRFTDSMSLGRYRRHGAGMIGTESACSGRESWRTLAALVVALAAPVAAGPLQDATAACGRGDYAHCHAKHDAEHYGLPVLTHRWLVAPEIPSSANSRTSSQRCRSATAVSSGRWFSTVCSFVLTRR